MELKLKFTVVFNFLNIKKMLNQLIKFRTRLGDKHYFHCYSCNYSSVVHGGLKENRNGFTQTCACMNCRELSDLKILRRYNSSIDKNGIAETYEPCLICSDSDVVPWFSDDQVCPKCGSFEMYEPVYQEAV